MRTFKLKKPRDEKGLTLVEILATIVILAIVLVAFSSFFLQSAKYTKFNEEKLTAVQVAESVVAEIRLNRHPSSLDDYSEVSTNIYENKTTYPEYEITIEVKSGPVELNRALISVRSLSDTDIKGSPFTTEMYFEVTP